MLALLFALNAYAAPEVAPVNKFSLGQALKMGMQYSLEIKNAEAEVRRRAANNSEVKSALFPTISLKAETGVTQSPLMNSSNFIDDDGEYRSYKTYLSATQNLYRGGAISSGLAATKLNLDGAKQRLLKARQDYSFAIIEAYLAAGYQQALVEIAKENRDILKSYAQVTARYASIGRSKNIDRLSAEASYNLSEGEVLKKESEAAQALEGLYALLGVESLDNPVLETTIPLQPIDTSSVTKLYQQALLNNPSIRTAELELQSAEYNVDVNMAKHRPTLNLEGTYGYSSLDRADLFDGISKTWTVFLKLEVPLFSGFSSIAESGRYKEEIFKQRKDLEIAKRDLQRRLAQYVVNLHKSFQRLKFTQLSSQSAKKAMDVALRDYRSGLISSTDVNQIQGTKYRADQENVNAQWNYHLEVLSLRRSLGTDLEKIYAQSL